MSRSTIKALAPPLCLHKIHWMCSPEDHIFDALARPVRPNFLIKFPSENTREERTSRQNTRGTARCQLDLLRRTTSPRPTYMSQASTKMNAELELSKLFAFPSHTYTSLMLVV